VFFFLKKLKIFVTDYTFRNSIFPNADRNIQLNTSYIQGVQINMGIERRLEFPIIDKWHNLHKKD